MKILPNRRLHYAWIVAAVAFLALLVSAGVRSAPGVFLVPLQSDTGWSRSWISFAIALNFATYGLMGPFAGACIARFGMRMTTAIGLAILAIGGAAVAWLHAVWQLLPVRMD
jgi:MFS family permease